MNRTQNLAALFPLPLLMSINETKSTVESTVDYQNIGFFTKKSAVGISVAFEIGTVINRSRLPPANFKKHRDKAGFKAIRRSFSKAIGGTLTWSKSK